MAKQEILNEDICREFIIPGQRFGCQEGLSGLRCRVKCYDKNEEWQSKAGTHLLQASNIGHAYVFGADAYENDEQAKKEIIIARKELFGEFARLNVVPQLRAPTGALLGPTPQAHHSHVGGVSV